MDDNYQKFPLKELTDLLNKETEYKANRELARRIVTNNKEAVNYYIGVLSLPIINHIEKTIINRDILSEFYEFLSNPFNKEYQKPEWRKVSLYKGETSRLDTYTTVITVRHFCKKAKKEKEITQKESELIDYIDYQTLLDCKDEDNTDELIPGSKIWKARKVFKNLSERDQLVIYTLMIEKKSALEAYPLIEPYIKPRAKDGKTSEEIKSEWSNKQKQDAISLIKARAVNIFIKKFLDLRYEQHR